MTKSKALEHEASAGVTTAFESDVQRSLSALRAALAAAIESLPEYPRRAPDLARRLNLERNVAWKLFRLVHEPDVFAAARFVPGPASIASFISNAAGAGVAPSLLDEVTRAADTYASVVRLHAGDRVSADIMLGVKSGEAGELALRRSAFRSTSFLAGVQTQAQLQTFIFGPSAGKPDLFDGVSLNGFVDLARVRPDAPVVIGRAMATDDSGTVVRPLKDEPIDGPGPETSIVPLLAEFCSTPLPRFRRVAAERGFVENELVEGPVGRTGAITFMAATVIRELACRFRDEQNSSMDLVARLRTPAAVLICDVLVHETIFGEAAPRAAVYSDLFGDALRRGPARDRYRLSSAHGVSFLGKGPGAASTPEIPRYPRMLQHVFDRLGWESGRFNAYRVRIEFPFTPTSLLVSFDLLTRP